MVNTPDSESGLDPMPVPPIDPAPDPDPDPGPPPDNGSEPGTGKEYPPDPDDPNA